MGIASREVFPSAGDDHPLLSACENGVYDALGASGGGLSIVFADRLCTEFCSLHILQPKAAQPPYRGDVLSFRSAYAATPLCYQLFLSAVIHCLRTFSSPSFIVIVVCRIMLFSVFIKRIPSLFVEWIKKERPTCFFYKLSALIYCFLPGGLFGILLCLVIV